jgi:hypothetical protein
VVRPAGHRPGERPFAGSDVKHAARPVGDDPFQKVEYLGRIRRPVPVRPGHPRVPERRGELIPRLSLAHQPP